MSSRRTKRRKINSKVLDIEQTIENSTRLSLCQVPDLCLKSGDDSLDYEGDTQYTYEGPSSLSTQLDDQNEDDGKY